MTEVSIQPKFKRGDIVTLKALTGQSSDPPRYSVSHWLHHGQYDDNGNAIPGETHFCLRRLYRDVQQVRWATRAAEGDPGVGERLRTGETSFSEFELCLYEEEPA
jgi:hypothetical protein